MQSRDGIYESAILLRFLGIILRFLRLEASSLVFAFLFLRLEASSLVFAFLQNDIHEQTRVFTID
jgi:hypothetical protein